MKFLRYTFLLLGLLLVGCGYGVNQTSYNVLPQNYRKVALASIENPTTMTWLDPQIRKLLRDELTNRGLVTWCDDAKQADAVMLFRIIRYDRPSAVTGVTGQTLQSEANFQFEVFVKSTTDDSLVWQSGTISQDWRFFQGGEAKVDADVTLLGIRRLADKMSQNY